MRTCPRPMIDAKSHSIPEALFLLLTLTVQISIDIQGATSAQERKVKTILLTSKVYPFTNKVDLFQVYFLDNYTFRYVFVSHPVYSFLVYSFKIPIIQKETNHNEEEIKKCVWKESMAK